ncbi:MAG: hypothetical protein WC700_09130 [Gemmatimonadaceae bacterium]|jgi:hypothetical protein
MKEKKPTVLRLADAPAASAAHWTPEDMLRATLADIEAGKIVANKAILVLDGVFDGEVKLATRQAGTVSGYEISGMIAEALAARTALSWEHDER